MNVFTVIANVEPLITSIKAEKFLIVFVICFLAAERFHVERELQRQQESDPHRMSSERRRQVRLCIC